MTVYTSFCFLLTQALGSCFLLTQAQCSSFCFLLTQALGSWLSALGSWLSCKQMFPAPLSGLAAGRHLPPKPQPQPPSPEPRNPELGTLRVIRRRCVATLEERSVRGLRRLLRRLGPLLRRSSGRLRRDSLLHVRELRLSCCEVGSPKSPCVILRRVV